MLHSISFWTNTKLDFLQKQRYFFTTHFPNSALISALQQMELQGFFLTTYCRIVSRTQGRVAPDWDLWRMLDRLSYSLAVKESEVGLFPHLKLTLTKSDLASTVWGERTRRVFFFFLNIYLYQEIEMHAIKTEVRNCLNSGRSRVRKKNEWIHLFLGFTITTTTKTSRY